MADLGNSPPTPPVEEVMKENEGTILKPKRVRRMTDEARAVAAERMRKINQERIDKSRIRREQEFAETEEKLKKKLEDIAAMKASIGVIKTKSKKVPPPEPPPQAPAGAELKAPKAPKKVIVKKPVVEESDEDSVDYGAKSDEESEEEVVYVAKKKSAAPKKEKTLLKERKSSTPAAAPAAPAPAQSVYRFI